MATSFKNLDLNLLTIFDVIYGTRSISHAANQLNMNQPTISNALGRLRKQLDDPLFVRDGRRMAPTSRAQEIIGPVRRALAEIHSINIEQKDFDPIKTEREFRLHMLATLDIAILKHLINQTVNAPKISFELLRFNNTPSEVAVASGEADIAIGLAPITNQELEWEPLCSLDLVLAARKGHPLAKNKKITQEDLFEYKHLMYNRTPTVPTAGTTAVVDKLVINKFPDFPVAAKIDHDLHMLMLANMSDAIALVPEIFIKSMPPIFDLEILPSPINGPQQPICLIWKEGLAPDSGIKWLCNQIKQGVLEISQQPLRRSDDT